MIGLMLALAVQDMGGMTMTPGTTMPMPAPRKPAAKAGAPPRARAAASRNTSAPRARAAPAATPTCAPEHAAMGHCKADDAHPAPMAGMAGMAMPAPGAAAPADPACAPEHAAMGHCGPGGRPGGRPVGRAEEKPGDTPAVTPAAGAVGTDRPAGNAAPPPAPATRAADAFYDPAAIAAADRAMRAEHGGMRFSQVILNIAEAQVRRGRDGYRWDGEGWFGGDVDRLVVKSQGEGGFGGRAEQAEVQALYARAIDPYWNLQAGVRQDVQQGGRTYAVLGVEGLAPYWFDVEGAVFVSDRGNVLARAEAWYDQRITQRLIAQPRIEVNLAAQDVRASGIGAGLSSAELGLRLRYEIRREFAPYVGVAWERRYGASARFARAGGDDAGGVALALGVRAWF